MLTLMLVLTASYHTLLNASYYSQAGNHTSGHALVSIYVDSLTHDVPAIS